MIYWLFRVITFACIIVGIATVIVGFDDWFTQRRAAQWKIMRRNDARYQTIARIVKLRQFDDEQWLDFVMWLKETHPEENW